MNDIIRDINKNMKKEKSNLKENLKKEINNIEEDK